MSVDRYAGRRFLVVGAGMAGAAAADALLRLGAHVGVTDQRGNAAIDRLAAAGARAHVGEAAMQRVTGRLADDYDEIVISPGFAPHTPIALAAGAAGLPIYSEPELAWRLRPAKAPAWLAVTGTNGKTTTTTMLAAVLAAAGLRTAAVGNIGVPLVDIAADTQHYDVLAVELSSAQLYWSTRLAPEAGALLNLADDHLEWHGGYAEYIAAKRRIWRSAGLTDEPAAGNGIDGLAIGNGDDVEVDRLLAHVPGRRVRVSLGQPKRGELGVIDGELVDWAFAEQPTGLASAAAVHPAGTHNVSNALHAAALARSYGVAPAAVAAGLAGYTPQPHRNAYVTSVAGVAYIDDSKATNPHAALASLTAYPRIVWIAGGQLKDVDVSELVRVVAPRLAGAVLLGVDRAQLATALARHAPAVPVIEVHRADDGAMTDVVAAAAALARAGDTVLLAPAAASKDMFDSYAQRGDLFAAAARALAR